MALAMSRWTPGHGLIGFGACCAPCHTSLGDDLCARNQPVDRPEFWLNGGTLDMPSSIGSSQFTGLSRDGGARRLTPRATTPPPELLVDGPMTSRSHPNLRAPAVDVSEKAQERARLRKLVDEFMREAANGRSCSVVPLQGDGFGCSGGPGLRRPGHYELDQEGGRLVLHRRTADASEEAVWEVASSCPLADMLGAQAAVDSALVQSYRRDLETQVTDDELLNAALLDFGGSGTLRGLVLVIEDSILHRDRLVSGVQILRLYKGAARRLESAKTSTWSRSTAMSRDTSLRNFCSRGADTGSSRLPGDFSRVSTGSRAINDDQDSDEVARAVRHDVSSEGVRPPRNCTRTCNGPLRLGVAANDEPVADSVQKISTPAEGRNRSSNGTRSSRIRTSSTARPCGDSEQAIVFPTR
eukprot:TRINITY_DN74951_c0_g1_i1.p1 TRINITY_DN74951_c0_g1~~TRINITY_DN74951_c0_g1_i1.p1  ORF type:complete len:412 (-),score=38.46 TRINITY_DN74951_c0_g1_i1:55-1290(-)